MLQVWLVVGSEVYEVLQTSRLLYVASNCQMAGNVDKRRRELTAVSVNSLKQGLAIHKTRCRG